MGAEDRVDSGSERLRSIDDKEPLAFRIDAARHDVFEQFLDHRGVLRGPFSDAQHVFVPLAVHAHRANHRVVAEQQPVDVNHQQLQLIEAPREQRLDLGLRSLDHLPAYGGLGNSHGLGHGGYDFLVVARGDAAHQDIQHPRPHLLAVVHRLVSGDFDLLAWPPSPAQAWPLDLQFAVAEHDLARLPAIEDHVPGASLALLRRTSCRLARRQLQHSLNGGTPGYIDQFVTGQPALLDQIDHGHEKLPALGQKSGQLLLVHFSLLAYGVVAFLHGGSPFMVWQPDSFRIRLNRRSTINYRRDILFASVRTRFRPAYQIYNLCHDRGQSTRPLLF